MGIGTAIKGASAANTLHDASADIGKELGVLFSRPGMGSFLGGTDVGGPGVQDAFLDKLSGLFNLDDSPDKENPNKETREQFVNDLSSGEAGRVNTAVGTHAMNSALDEGKLDGRPDAKTFHDEKDVLLAALSGVGLSFEESETYRKSFLASENIKPLDRDDFSSESAFREANFVQLEGAIGIKADNNGVSREETMMKGAEKSSTLGDFTAVASVIGSGFALSKLFEDNETVQNMMNTIRENLTDESLQASLGTWAVDLKHTVEDGIDKAEELFKEGMLATGDAIESRGGELEENAHKYLPEGVLDLMGMNENKAAEGGISPVGDVSQVSPSSEDSSPKDGVSVENLTSVANASAVEKEGKTVVDEISAIVDTVDKDVDVDVSAGQSRGL